MKLIQKRFFQGIREFEIIDDIVNVHIKSALKEEKITVSLSVLNPEPVTNNKFLEFHSRVKCEPLLSLYINNPDKKTFNSFVTLLKERAQNEYKAFAGLKTTGQPPLPEGNVFEAPPEFDDTEQNSINKVKSVDINRLDESISMLETYLDVEGETKSFIDALRSLKQEPENESRIIQAVEAFNNLDSGQGAVLTYAPYLNTLLSDDPFSGF